MSSTVVHVKNISHETSEKEVRDFFSFCGKITSLSVTPTSDAADSTKSATVTFEKETAAKTALLLDNTQLGPSQVQVAAAANIDDIAASASHAEGGAHEGEDDISQDDKPRSRIFAEYLAHGYVLSDTAIQRAIALDNKHGISSRFTNALTNFDAKYKATDKAKGIDTSYGISDKAATGWKGLSSYFEKAMGTPTGQKLAEFYTKGNKEVTDIHKEARRLADLKSGKPSTTVQGGNQHCECGGNTGVCTCTDGKCTCSGCAKTGDKSATNTAGVADTAGLVGSTAPTAEKS